MLAQTHEDPPASFLRVGIKGVCATSHPAIMFNYIYLYIYLIYLSSIIYVSILSLSLPCFLPILYVQEREYE